MDGLDKNECCVACGDVMILACGTSLFWSHYFKRIGKSLFWFNILCIGLGPSSKLLWSRGLQGLTLLDGAKFSFWVNEKVDDLAWLQRSSVSRFRWRGWKRSWVSTVETDQHMNTPASQLIFVVITSQLRKLQNVTNYPVNTQGHKKPFGTYSIYLGNKLLVSVFPKSWGAKVAVFLILHWEFVALCILKSQRTRLKG